MEQRGDPASLSLDGHLKKINLPTWSKTSFSLEWTFGLTRVDGILTHSPCKALAPMLRNITSGFTQKTRETCDASALFQQRDGEEVSRRRQTAGDKRTVVWTDLGLNALWCSAGGIYAPTAAGSGCRIYLAPRDITAR